MTELPTGQTESQTLEFNLGAILGDPKKIAREIVAMLNASGGAIWIGVPEENGVALGPIPIPDADDRRLVLLDQLIDLIQPTPTHNELKIEPVPAEGGNVLKITVLEPKRDRQPFAWTSRGLLGFSRRMDHRIDSLNLEEVRAMMQPGGSDQSASVPNASRQWLASQLHDGGEHPRARIAFAPLNAQDDLNPVPGDARDSWESDVPVAPEHLKGGLGGWFFTGTEFFTEPTHMGVREIHPPVERGRKLTARSNGRVVSGVESIALLKPGPERKVENHLIFHPYVVMRWIRASCYLAGRAMQVLRMDEKSSFVADLRIEDAQRAPWLSSSPGSTKWVWSGDELMQAKVGNEVQLLSPFKGRIHRLIEDPEGAAVGLIERLYEALGFDAKHLPIEVDVMNRRFKSD